MFKVTFIGHQGWLFSTERTHLLIDPLLTPGFGHGGIVGQVHPPRTLDVARLPPLDAVLITHEHEDHFDVPSLNRLDRRTPILLSARSSGAARDLLGEMGFEVREVDGGDRIELGELEIQLFSPDVVHMRDDEYDVVQFLVAHRDGHGSFFSSVDAELGPARLLELRELAPSPGIFAHTNNMSWWGFAHAGSAPPPEFPDTAKYLSLVSAEQSTLRETWGTPAAVVFCGGGYALTGDLEPLNRHAFPADTLRAAAALSALYPGETILAPLPGQALVMREGAVVEVEGQSSFLSARPRSDWPDRDFVPTDELIDLAPPATGVVELEEAAVAELLSKLDDFALYLHAGPLFRALYSGPPVNENGQRDALVLVLDGGPDGAPLTLEYQPQRCRFAPVDCESPQAEYAVGIECWAADLLAALRGELAPTALCFGRARSWCGTEAIEEAAASEVNAFVFWNFFHPLRRPQSFLALYRRLLGKEPADVPRAKAAKRPARLQITR